MRLPAIKKVLSPKGSSAASAPAGNGWSLARLYLFFFYFPGVTHVLLQLTNATIFNGFRQTVYVSLLWLIPVLLFPGRTRQLTALIGIVLWATSLVSLGYYCLYQQEFSQSVLFIIFESNFAESSEFLAHYFQWWIMGVFAVYTAIGYWLWRGLRPVYLSTRKAYVTTAVILSFLFVYPIVKNFVFGPMAWAKTVSKIQSGMQPAAPWNLVFGYTLYQGQLAEMEGLLQTNKQLPPLTGLKDRFGQEPRTLVLVIGESTNRQHMQIYGYGRPTTPELEKLKPELAVFDQVYSPRPYTIEVLEQALTFADEENPDLYLKKPSLMNLMKQAGYKTFWITNQQTLTGRNTMLTNFSKQMDVQVYLNHARAQDSRQYDENVLAPLDKVLTDPAPRKFIVLHLLGAHMKYSFRYPETFDRFKGYDGLPQAVRDSRADVINEYDNAILYNDFVVSSIIGRVRKAGGKSALVYFADHGEDVYDSATHRVLGRNEGAPTLAMYAVPFMVWTSPAWDGIKTRDLQPYASRVYSTAQFIHTWSDLAGLRFDDFEPQKSLFNAAYQPITPLIGNPSKKANLRPITAAGK